MHPFWITFKPPRPPFGMIGAGVTAYSEADAAAMCSAAFGDSARVSSIRRVASVDELDQNHVVPNMGNWLRRGIWFPAGMDHGGADVTPPQVGGPEAAS